LRINQVISTADKHFFRTEVECWVLGEHVHPERLVYISAREFEPAYMALYRSGELQRRAEAALQHLAHCLVCPRNCGVDRLADKTASCKTGRYAVVGSYFPHFGEEDCLRGWNGSGN
jgi:uncharacterized Fe-S radical SAM superfamily protein PflX